MSYMSSGKIEHQWEKRGIKQATIHLYQALLARQNNTCRLCPSVPGRRRFILDFQRSTGRVRGILCPICSQNVRQVERLLEDKSILDVIIDYIAAAGEPIISEAEGDVVGIASESLLSKIDSRRELMNRRFRELFIDGLEKSAAIKQVAVEFGKCERTVRRHLGMK